MLTSVKHELPRLAACLAVALAMALPSPARAQAWQDQPSSTGEQSTYSEDQGTSYQFRWGELTDRAAKAAAQCQRQNQSADLASVEYVRGVEADYYKVNFTCGAESSSPFPVIYKSGDGSRIDREIGEFCKQRNKAAARVETDAAPTAGVYKVMFQCR
jgi:hypothetical protein